MSQPDEAWERYGRALTEAMTDVLDEVPEDARPHVLETADYWLSVGLALGLEHAPRAKELLALIEAEEAERAGLAADAAAFLAEALA